MNNLNNLDGLAKVLKYSDAEVKVQDIFDGYQLTFVSDDDATLKSLFNKVTGENFNVYSFRILIKGDYLTCFQTDMDYSCSDDNTVEIDDFRKLLLDNKKAILATMDLSKDDKRWIDAVESALGNSKHNVMREVNRLINRIYDARGMYMTERIVSTPVSVVEWLLKNPDPLLSKRNYYSH